MGPWPKSFADYKPNYFSRLNKSNKDIHFESIFALGSWRNLGYFYADPLPSFNWWAVSVGGEELKWRQLAHHQLMSQQGPILVHTVKLSQL